jgi:hypothetical protein
MSKEFIVSLIQNKDLVGGIVILLVSAGSWAINILLGIKAFKNKPNWLKIALFIIASLIYSFAGRFVFSLVFFGIISYLLLAIIIYIDCKKIVAFLVSAGIMILSAAGDIVLFAIFVYNKDFGLFVRNNPLGMSVGILFESAFPLLVLIFLCRSDIKMWFLNIYKPFLTPLTLVAVGIVGILYITGSAFFTSNNFDIQKFALFLTMFLLVLLGVCWYINGLKRQIKQLQEIKGLLSTKGFKAALRKYRAQTSVFMQFLSDAIEEVEK